jgi:Fe-S-cluster containining protein
MTGNPENQVFTSLEGDSFCFRCHKDIPCFNACCAGLRLALTPYDVLRLKNRLGLTGEEFMDSYTEIAFEKTGRFPIVLLKMSEEENRPCPFVLKSGCLVYSDRPGACRIYPLGRASGFGNTAMEPMAGAGPQGVKEKFFLVRESHCRGFDEDKQWTVGEWLRGEGLDEYNAVNDRWLQIIISKSGLGDDHAVMKKMQMYIMACYNLEKFRAFIFMSSFFRHFKVSPGKKRQLAENEKALLLFAFDWLRFSLFGEKTLQL